MKVGHQTSLQSAGCCFSVFYESVLLCLRQLLKNMISYAIMSDLIITMDFLTMNPINLEETKKWRIYFPMNG